MEEIADLDAGLLAPERISAARAHLQHCDECGARAAALETATTSLRSLGTVPIPDEVAARIDAALAAERSTGEGDSAPATPLSARSQSATVIPDLGEVRRRRLGRPSLAASAAAVVLILAITAIVVGHGSGHHKSLQAAGATGEGLGGRSAISQSVRPVSTGRTYTPSNLASLVPGLLEQRTPTTLNPSPAAGLPAPVPSSSDGVGAAGGTAGSGASGTASGGGGGATTSSTHHKSNAGQPPVAAPNRFAPVTTNAPVPRALTRYSTSATALIDCAQKWAPFTGAVPEVVDFGRWTNPDATSPVTHVPALIMVFADPSDANAVTVYVLRASCDSSAVLTFRRVTLSS
jgi:hypothetical protein